MVEDGEPAICLLYIKFRGIRRHSQDVVIRRIRYLRHGGQSEHSSWYTDMARSRQSRDVAGNENGMIEGLKAQNSNYLIASAVSLTPKAFIIGVKSYSQ